MQYRTAYRYCKLAVIRKFSVISNFEKNSILTDYQHGIRKRRSCETQLILTIDDLARGLNDKQQICSDYFIHNQKLALRTEAKYLGVTTGSDLSWSKHADNITKKTHSTMGFLKRNIRSAPQAAKETAYKTFVRPIVEYAATTWAPFTDTETRKIEMVRRRAARFVSNDYRRTSGVTEMISTLGWDTLYKRRGLARLSMMYRIVHHLVDIPVEPYLTLSTSMTRGHTALAMT